MPTYGKERIGAPLHADAGGGGGRDNGLENCSSKMTFSMLGFFLGVVKGGGSDQKEDNITPSNKVYCKSTHVAPPANPHQLYQSATGLSLSSLSRARARALSLSLSV